MTGLSGRLVTILTAFFLLCGRSLYSQQFPPANQKTPVVRATTRLVQVDVVALDKANHPLSDLRQEEFELREDGKTQRVAFFSFSKVPAKSVRPASSDSHVYTNLFENNAGSGPASVLLLDGVNGSPLEQSYARRQMLAFLRDELPLKQKIAVLALTDRLMILQDFTADPSLLRAAIEKFVPRKSLASAQGEPLQVTPEFLDAVPPEIRERLLDSLQKFNDQGFIQSVEARAQITLEALNAIGRATARYPGRKALVWISAAFPFSLVASDIGSAGLSQSYVDEIKRTATLLRDARVAVYPVDARGLSGLLESEIGPRRTRQRGFTNPISQVGESGGELARNQSSVNTMNELAESTGGRAFTDRNDLSAAVAEALSENSTFYTLAYYPENRHWDGELRRIRVHVHRKDVQLRYRRGYYARDGIVSGIDQKKEDLRAALESPLAATGLTLAVRLHSVRQVDNEKAISLEVQVDPQTVDFEEAGNEMKIDLELLAGAFFKGELIGTKTANVTRRLRRMQNQPILEQIPLKIELQVPERCETLRIVVRDNRSGLIGTTNVPLLNQSPKSQL